MAAIGFVVPVLPGKAQADRDWLAEMGEARRAEYEAVWKKHGLTRHMVWQQETPNGTVDVVFLEADDIPTAMQGITSSDDEFSQWFRDRVKDVHGIDLKSDPTPVSTQIHDHGF
ncbi:hypothetical protein [Mycobacterium sp. URHB0044]|jgi:hypothetical protein|uniref:hypothetical protein n=1 Tax=Mycobacterium sp. URHB0044 TaxID=1380386 RepID=UPI0012DE43CC|nr:hypothetical protein [Mycobacterium sp. URHB0044]